MTHECEKNCYCDKSCCCEKSCCEKKCKACKFVGYVLCTALISFLVVKFTAPCIVHDAFVKKVGEHHLHMMMKMAEMLPGMMHPHFDPRFDPMFHHHPKSPKGPAPMDKPAK